MGRWPGTAERPCGPKEAMRAGHVNRPGRATGTGARTRNQAIPVHAAKARMRDAAAPGGGPPAARQGTSAARGSQRMDFRGRRDAAHSSPGKAVMAIMGRRGEAGCGTLRIEGGGAPTGPVPSCGQAARASGEGRIQSSESQGRHRQRPSGNGAADQLYSLLLGAAWMPSSATDRIALAGRMGATQSR